jgi:hypothetical protein
VAAIERPLTTPRGRARLALAGAFNNVQGWYASHDPRPTDLDEWIRQQAAWIQNAYTVGPARSRARTSSAGPAGTRPGTSAWTTAASSRARA